MFIWIHVITWIVLLIAVVIALFGKRLDKAAVIVARICYLFLIGSGIFLVKFAWGRDPLFTIIKIVLALVVIGIIEMAFAEKRKGKLTDFIKWTAVIGILLVGVIGLLLAEFRPFIHYLLKDSRFYFRFFLGEVSVGIFIL